MPKPVDHMAVPVLFRQQTFCREFCRGRIFTLFNKRACLHFGSNDPLNYRMTFSVSIEVWMLSVHCHFWWLEDIIFKDLKTRTSVVIVLEKMLRFPFKHIVIFFASSHSFRILFPSCIRSVSTLSWRTRWLHAVRAYVWQIELQNDYRKMSFGRAEAVSPAILCISQSVAHCWLLLLVASTKSVSPVCLPRAIAWSTAVLYLSHEYSTQPGFHNVMETYKNQLK